MICGGDQLNHFGETIDNDNDRIEGVAFWKSCDEIYGNVFQGFEGILFGWRYPEVWREGLSSLTYNTCFHIFT